jgi:hypothetical protein
LETEAAPPPEENEDLQLFLGPLQQSSSKSSEVHSHFFYSSNWVLLDFLCAGCIFAIANFSRDIKRTHARPPMALNPQLHSLLLQARDTIFP